MEPPRRRLRRKIGFKQIETGCWASFGSVTRRKNGTARRPSLPGKRLRPTRPLLRPGDPKPHRSFTKLLENLIPRGVCLGFLHGHDWYTECGVDSGQVEPTAPSQRRSDNRPALQLQRRYLKTKKDPPSRRAGMRRRVSFCLASTKNREARSLFSTN